MRTISSKKMFYFFRSIVLLFLIGFLFCFQASVVSAQGTVTASINILLNRNVMQTIQIPDVTESNDNVGVTITTDNTSAVSLSLLRADESDDTFDVDSGALTGTATAENNGNVTFFIKGLSHGTSTLTFSFSAGTDTVKQLVNVIGIEAKIDVDDVLFGEAPLFLEFTDSSEDGNGIDGITNKEQKWIFSDDNGIEIIDGDIDNEDITLEFSEEGLQIVTLEITADIEGIGPVTDSTSTAVCVFPETEEEDIVPGTGSVHGVVWFEGEVEDGVESRVPLPFAFVILVGEDRRRTRISNLRGIYKFKNVPTGENYTMFACLGGVCDEGDEGEFDISDGDSINIDFVLVK